MMVSLAISVPYPLFYMVPKIHKELLWENLSCLKWYLAFMQLSASFFSLLDFCLPAIRIFANGKVPTDNSS